VLVMLGDAYVPGALAAAQSLRDVKTRHALVCMTTPDVSEAARSALRLLYDRVAEVPLISHPSRAMPSAKQVAMYGEWIARSYTKWNVLDLDYAKVVLVDADMIFLTNCDELFELRAPAACYSFAWAEPFRRGGVPNGYLSSRAADLAHGALVPAAAVLAAVRSKGRAFVGGTSLTLLEPDAARLCELRAMLAAAPVYAAGSGCVNGVDEISIAEVYAARGVDWTHIHPRYTAIPWKTAWVSRDIRAYHYQGRKPWLMAADEWPDLKDWWRTAQRLPAPARLFIEPDAARLVDVTAAELQLTRDLVTMVVESAAPSPTKASKFKGAKTRPYTEAARQKRAQRAIAALMPWLAALAAQRTRGWSALYCASSFSEDECNNDLASALIAGKLAAPEDAGGLVRELVKCVAKRLARPPQRIPSAGVVHDADILAFGSHFHTQTEPATSWPNQERDSGPALIAELIRRAGAEATLASLMRHAAALTDPAVGRLDDLYGRGFRFEGFASPFSRALAGDGATFCSPFPDTDVALGALGDFFGVTAGRAPLPAGNWLIRPPAVSAILVAAAARVLEMLARDSDLTRIALFVVNAEDGRDATAVRHILDPVAAPLVGESRASGACRIAYFLGPGAAIMPDLGAALLGQPAESDKGGSSLPSPLPSPQPQR
jgi:hypothetical protein